MELHDEEVVILGRPAEIVCSCCSQLLPRADFYGKGNWCRMCQSLRHHHLTRNDYNVMLEVQNGRCAICGTDDPGERVDRFVVDHDHSCCDSQTYSCGECVRGLLCATCNLMLGYAKDDPVLLSNAMTYLNTR